jgi:hypothetical protein
MLHWMQSKIKERVMRPGQLHALRSQQLAHHSFHQQELLVINLGSEGGGAYSDPGGTKTVAILMQNESKGFFLFVFLALQHIELNFI